MAKERVERDEEDLVRLYLTDIGQYPLLTKDDEVRLAQTIEGGREAELELAAAPKGLTPTKRRELRRKIATGEQAQQTFVQSNLRLVVSIAKKYQASGLPLLGWGGRPASSAGRVGSARRTNSTRSRTE